MTDDEPSLGAEITLSTGKCAEDSSATMPPGKLLGRTQAARLLGVSKSTLRRMEGQRLTPVVGPKNVHLFHEEQVQSLIVTRRSAPGSSRVTGDNAADAFELFDDSVHPVDVVKRLRIEPEVVEALHERWCRMRGLLTLTEAGTAALHRMLCDRDSATSPTSEPELLAEVKEWVAELSLRHCEQCRSEHAAFCRTCAKAWGARVAGIKSAERASRRL